MNWRWLILDYTDSALPLTRRERRGVWWKAQNLAHGLNHPAAGLRAPRALKWIHLALPGVGIVLGTNVLTLLFPGRLVMVIVAPAVSFTLTWVLMTHLGKWVWRPHVNQALREMGYDVCGWCGYWLRGLDDSTRQCPECGRARVMMEKPQRHSENR